MNSYLKMLLKQAFGVAKTNITRPHACIQDSGSITRPPWQIEKDNIVISEEESTASSRNSTDDIVLTKPIIADSKAHPSSLTDALNCMKEIPGVHLSTTPHYHTSSCSLLTTKQPEDIELSSMVLPFFFGAQPCMLGVECSTMAPTVNHSSSVSTLEEQPQLSNVDQLSSVNSSSEQSALQHGTEPKLFSNDHVSTD